jgi:hypothetical protein
MWPSRLDQSKDIQADRKKINYEIEKKYEIDIKKTSWANILLSPSLKLNPKASWLTNKKNLRTILSKKYEIDIKKPLKSTPYLTHI